MERKEIYNIVDGERDYQDMKWDSRNRMNLVADEDKAVSEWINYIEFHIQKAKDSVYYLDNEKALAELRKVVALGVRAMEIHGCPIRVTNTDPIITN